MSDFVTCAVCDVHTRSSLDKHFYGFVYLDLVKDSKKCSGTPSRNYLGDKSDFRKLAMRVEIVDEWSRY